MFPHDALVERRRKLASQFTRWVRVKRRGRMNHWQQASYDTREAFNEAIAKIEAQPSVESVEVCTHHPEELG